MEQNKNSPILSKESMRNFFELYNPPDPSDVTVSPLLASSFTNQPSAYIQIAGLDPMRDEGLAYATKLKNAKYESTQQ